MQKHMEKSRISRALKYSVPPAADNHYQPRDQVPVWREKIVNNLIGEWICLFSVMGMEVDKKLVYVQDVKVGNARLFNVAQVKWYIYSDDISHYFILDIARELNNLSSVEEQKSDMLLTEILSLSDTCAIFF